MKKTYLLLLALSFFVMDVLLAQTEQKDYYPLIPETGEKQWDTRRDFIWGESDYLIWWLGDDIELDGVLYRKMHYVLEGSGYHFTGLEGAFREEDKKVFVRGWDSGLQHFNEERLYYDFDLQVGDSFNVCSYSEPCFIQVVAIEEVEMEDGTLRKKIVFNDGWGGEENETWIEGVGSLAGVSHRFDPNLVGSFFSHLQCYFEEGNLNWTDGECWDDTEENLSENICLHPNPTRGMVYVDAENLQKVEVLNLYGQRVQCQESSAIDLFGLSAGVYVVRITDGEGHVEVRKVVKE